MSVCVARSGSLGLYPLMIFGCFFLGCTQPDQSPEKPPADSIVQKSEKSGVELLVEVSPKQPSLSDLVNLTITVSFPTTVTVEPPTFGQSVGDFSVRDYRQQESSGTSEQPASNRQRMVIRYQLEPMYSGRHLIRSIPIVFSPNSRMGGPNTDSGEAERDILQSDPIEIEVVSEFGESAADLSQVTPMFEPLDTSENRYIGLVVTAFAILILGSLAFWYARRRGSKHLAESRLSPEDFARAALSQLIAEQLPSKGLVKEFYLRLTGIVRIYIEEKTGLRAPEQTTEEFLCEMRSSRFFDAAQSNRLQEFLLAADLVKYAGQKPDESNIQQSVERAREFISLQFDCDDPTDNSAADQPNSLTSQGGQSQSGRNYQERT